MSELTHSAVDDYRPLKGVGRVAQVSIVVSLVMNIFGSILNVAGAELGVSDLKNLGALLNIVGNLFVILALPISLLAMGFLIVWLRRGIRNLYALNVSTAKARDWQAFSFIIPVLNLFMPMLVMQEVWKASDPKFLDGESWRSAPPSPLIMGYWISLVVQILLFLVTAFLPNEHLAMALEAFSLATSILLVMIIGQLSSRQESKRTLLLPPTRA